jgi:predicted phosphoribosyltransferase
MERPTGASAGHRGRPQRFGDAIGPFDNADAVGRSGYRPTAVRVDEPRLRDRRDAGRRLAERLKHYAGRDDVVVLGLPRGGVPVAFEVAEAIGAPLDVFVVRKLGVPGQQELAVGAIASGGTRVLNAELAKRIGLRAEWIEAIDAKERRELERRERAYRGDRPPPDVSGRTVILVDDGLATGFTMLAAVSALGAANPERVVVAVPVADPRTCEAIGRAADEAVCLLTPTAMHSVGEWYEDFSQTSDEEVRELLGRAPQATSVGLGRAATLRRPEPRAEA